MSDQPSPAPPPRRRRTNPLVLFLMAFIPVACVALAMWYVQIRKPQAENKKLNSDLIYKTVGLKDAAPITLDPRFTDADGDLVADPPANPKDQIDPPTLMFSFVATHDPEAYRERFKEFVAFLSQKIGKPVEYVLFSSPEQQLRALQEGRLHVAGINTGNIPIAVNQCGFIPICNLASEKGVATYQMQIIVPADSPIHTLKDLKGRELTLTEPGSNSGFKAPLVLLSRDQGLMPGGDFAIRYSGGHDESIKGIASKTYQAAAVASDILTRAVANGEIKKEQYRVIYESADFPTAGFGYVYNLKPELAAKIKDAFFGFEWKGTGVEKEFAGSQQSKFSPVSYNKHFELVRRIDDEIRSVRTVEPGEEATTEPATTSATTQAAK